MSPNSANSHPEEGLENEALFMGIIDRIGLDVVVGAMRRRREVIDQKKKGSVLEAGDVQLTIFPDRVEFAVIPGEGQNWQGALGFDDARHVLSTYIDDQLHQGPEPGE